MNGIITSGMQLLHDHRLVLPADLALLLRVLLRLQGLGRGVQTEVRVTELVEPYVHQMMAERFDPRRIARQVGRSVRSWDHFISGLPDDLRAILEQIRTGSVGVDFRIHDADHAVDRLVDGLVTAASIMAGAQLISRRTAPLVGAVLHPRTPRRRRRRGHVAAAHHSPQAARHVGHQGPQDPRRRSELTTRRAASSTACTTIAGTCGLPEPMCGASFGARGRRGCDVRVARRVTR